MHPLLKEVTNMEISLPCFCLNQTSNALFLFCFLSFSLQDFERPLFIPPSLFLLLFFFLIPLIHGSLHVASSLANNHQPTQPFSRNVVAHDNEPGLSAGASLTRRPQLPDGVQPFPQDGVRDQVQDYQDPACAEPLPLGKVQEVRTLSFYFLKAFLALLKISSLL